MQAQDLLVAMLSHIGLQHRLDNLGVAGSILFKRIPLRGEVAQLYAQEQAEARSNKRAKSNSGASAAGAGSGGGAAMNIDAASRSSLNRSTSASNAAAALAVVGQAGPASARMARCALMGKTSEFFDALKTARDSAPANGNKRARASAAGAVPPPNPVRRDYGPAERMAAASAHLRMLQESEQLPGSDGSDESGVLHPYVLIPYFPDELLQLEALENTCRTVGVQPAVLICEMHHLCVGANLCD